MTCIPWAGDTGVPSGQGVGTNLVVWLLGRVPGALCTPCHSLPSPGAWSSLPDLLQTRWGQGWVVQLCSCRKGLGSGGSRGGGMASLLDPCIFGPVPWGTLRAWILEKLWSLPRHSACSEVPVSPYTREGATGDRL